MFGKYLNNCPTKIVEGFSAWYANGGSTYYAPSFAVSNIDGLEDGLLKYNATDYSTSLIGNYSLAWIKKVASDSSGLPWMAYIGPKACHDPFHPAKWYEDTWEEGWPATAPRPVSWNVSQATLAKHHPTISGRPPFGAQTASCIDEDFKNRWRTLLSVDDLVAAVVELVDEELQLADNTYYIYSSDHGYSLGELNLNWDKRNVYDFDTRIHLLVKGPGIVPGSSVDFLASNVDLAPTFLSLANVERPPGMDGKSFLPMLLGVPTPAASGAVAVGGAVPPSVATYIGNHPKRTVEGAWRQVHFIEYYYVGIGGYCGMPEPIELPDNNFIALRGGDFLYAEFQNGTDGNINFQTPAHFELFDLHTDPWQMKNVYDQANASTKASLHAEVHLWLACKEATCP